MSTQLGDRDRQSVSLILKGGRHLLELINEVLDISHIESGRLTLSIEPVDVHEICVESLELVRHMANERGITLEIAAKPAATIYAETDSQRFRQILLNLFSNAVKFNRPNGHVAVRIEESLADQKVRVYVMDTGRGIPLENQQKLFRPFERLASQASGDGPGIGLALSDRLAKAMGGSIGLKSEPDQGSTFWVELPRSTEPLGQLQFSLTGENDPASPGQFLILYIEDNLANIRLMQGLLVQRPKIKLLVALRGDVGLEMAWTHKPNLVLLDMHLPDMTGLEVLDSLQETKETCDIPVVVISADSSPRQAERVKARGATAFIQKPFNLAEFLRMLDEFVEGHA
jgi:CheY-like chemotaxis protein